MQEAYICLKPDGFGNIGVNVNPRVLCMRYDLRAIFIDITTFNVEVKGRAKVIEKESYIGVLDDM